MISMVKILHSTEELKKNKQRAGNREFFHSLKKDKPHTHKLTNNFQNF